MLTSNMSIDLRFMTNRVYLLFYTFDNLCCVRFIPLRVNYWLIATIRPIFSTKREILGGLVGGVLG
jgi:hypothetical protein